MTQIIAPTEFQQEVLAFRGHCHILNAGGRGSGKSYSLILDLLDHCRDLGSVARPLVLRESWPGLQELQAKVYELAVTAFGPTSARNKAEGTISLPNGAIITFTNIGDETSYVKLQGRSFTALFADEVGGYPPQAFQFMQRTRSNLRAPKGVRTNLHLTANPGGRSHSVLYRDWIKKAPPWTPFQDHVGDWWVWTTSAYTDNPHIDQASYARQLTASVGADAQLADAWLNGHWGPQGGEMFSNFDPKVHCVPDRPFGRYRDVVGADWGTAAPATATLHSYLLDPVGPYHAGSIFVCAEIDTADPNDLSLGIGAPPAMFAEMIREMLGEHGSKPFTPVVCDDARGLNTGETVVGMLREAGLRAMKPRKKDRTGTWVLVRQLLENAKTGDGPGLYYVAKNCPHLLETLTEAPRSPLRPEDIDPKWNRDHWIDGHGYGVKALHDGPPLRVGRTRGDY